MAEIIMTEVVIALTTLCSVIIAFVVIIVILFVFMKMKQGRANANDDYDDTSELHESNERPSSRMTRIFVPLSKRMRSIAPEREATLINIPITEDTKPRPESIGNDSMLVVSI